MSITDPDHVERVLQALDGAPSRCGDTRVVAIDGPSGSGKTTLARGVSKAVCAPILHMDDLFPGWDGLHAAGPLLLDQVLLPLSRLEPATYRQWDWIHDRWGSTRTLPDCDLLIIEGCSSSVGPAGELAAVRVWVEAPPTLRMQRGIARDGEAYRPHWQRWAIQEDRLFADDDTRAKAEVIVATG